MPMALGLGLGLPYIAAASGPYPALDLNFATMATLDSRVTYTGASLATLTNSAGNIAYKPHNLALWSEDLANAVWVKSGCTITADATVAPDGNSTADLVVVTGAPGSGNVQSSAPSSTSGTVTFSVYAKAGSRSIFNLTPFNGSPNTDFNLSTASKTDNGGAVGSITSVGNGWYRCSCTVTLGAPSTQRSFIWSADGIYLWGAQLNIGPLQPYYPATSAAYYGPRFTYDPITLNPLGLLIEEQRTNLLTYSEQFGNAAWNASSGVPTANATTAPDGSVTADRFTAAAGLSYHYFTRTTPASLTGAHTYSFRVKKDTATWIFFSVTDSSLNYFNLDTGVFGTTPDTCSVSVLPGGWYQINVTRTLTAALANCGCGVAGSNGGANFTAAGTESIYLWGAQLEAGAFATSYIPTTSASVTRAADSATMTGANFSSWFNATQGTFVPETRRASATVYGGIMATDNGGGYSGGAGMLVCFNNAGSVEAGGNSSAVSRTGLNAVGSLDKVAYNYSVGGSNPMNISANGGAVGNLATTDYTGIGVARLIIGGGPNGALNAPISRLRYYPTALTNAQLQALTT